MRCALMLVSRLAMGLSMSMTLSAAQTSGPQARSPWLDVELRPLPFASDEELLEFLRVAEVESESVIGTGVNESKKIVLVRDDVRSHAIFREVELRRENVRMQEKHYHFFADSYLFEVAAYELSRILGLHRIPPAIVREIDGRRGSVQIWLEQSQDEQAEDFRAPNPLSWVKQIWDMYFFDALIHNTDRNKGNILAGMDYKLWLIDHTRGFQAKEELLLPERIVRVNRQMWERLRDTDESLLREALRPYLTPLEMGMFLRRRRSLLARVDELLEARSPAIVLYEH